MNYAITNGANIALQEKVIPALSQAAKILLIDNLSINSSENIKHGTLIKRSLLEVGPIEMALRKEDIFALLHYPQTSDLMTDIETEEKIFSETLGLIKICEKLKIQEFHFLKPSIRPELIASTITMLNEVKLAATSVTIQDLKN